jgi:hypothetical protein
MKIILGDFNARTGKENILKPKNGNESLSEINNNNGVRMVYFATSKNVIVKSTIFLHRNIYEFISTSPDSKTQNQIYHILIDRKRYSDVLHILFFRGAEYDTGLSLVAGKIREEFAISKRAKFDM